MATTAVEIFSPTRFLKDVERTCAAIGAPFSESVTRAVVEAYSQCFHEGVVSWRTTDRPGDPLNFRFYQTRPVDTIKIAVDAGFIKADNAMVPMITSWSSLYDGIPEQSCDFDPKTGLTKAWVYMGGQRPLEDILSIPDVPDSIRRHQNTFQSLELKLVRHVSADYHSNTVNIYFLAPGPISDEKVAKLVKLAGCPPPTSFEVLEMRQFLNPNVFTFSVTMAYATGDIKRVAFYALKLPPGSLPRINERLTHFFSETPSYDKEDMNGIAWSFGKGGKNFLKAERSYCGELVSLMRIRKSALTS